MTHQLYTVKQRQSVDLQCSGFGSPIVSQEGGDLVVVNVNVYAMHHLLAAERLTQPTDTDANVKAAGRRLMQT